MKCTKCHNYSFPLRRCLLGWINPPTIKGGAQAIDHMGINYICTIDNENRKRAQKCIDLYKQKKLKKLQEQLFSKEEEEKNERLER